jgi:protein-disulfide isomerase
MTPEVLMVDSRSWHSWLDALVSVVVILALSILIGKTLLTRAAEPAGRPAPEVPSEPVSLQGATLRGRETAKVAMIEFSDFQCPYCARFAQDTLPGIISKYVDTGILLFAFRHLPLEQIHPLALGAAEAAECAARQGRFSDMHDQLFSGRGRLDPNGLAVLAGQIGLEPAAFSDCLNGNATQRVKDDIRDARALGITGTPTFLVGLVQEDGRLKVTDRLSGARSLEEFEAIFDKLSQR